ncbi:MAG: hypothetical protein ACREBR_04725 [bacterium]
MKKTIDDIDGYGELIAYATDGYLWSFKMYGSYQGDYIAIIEKDHKILIYKGYYGSCSSCDWLGDKQHSEEFNDESIQEHVKNEVEIFLEIPKNQFFEMSEDEFAALLPGNTRTSQDDDDLTIESVFKQITERQINNLEYLEWAHANSR